MTLSAPINSKKLNIFLLPESIEEMIILFPIFEIVREVGEVEKKSYQTFP